MTAKSLPPVPAFDCACVRLVRLSTRVGEARVLCPSIPDFLCVEPKAPILLMLPGLGMDPYGYLRQLPLGAISHLRLLANPDHAIDGEEGLDNFARFVEEYVRAAKLDEHPGGLVIGGCSMGGAVSLRVAIRGNLKLRGLVLLGTFGNCLHLPAWQRHAAPLAHILPISLCRGFVRAVISRSKHFGRLTREEGKWLVSTKFTGSRKFYCRAIGALTRQQQIEGAKKLKIPTLILHGTDDRVLPLAAGMELHQSIAGSKFIAIPQSGHSLFFTDHEIVNTGIAEFLEGLL